MVFPGASDPSKCADLVLRKSNAWGVVSMCVTSQITGILRSAKLPEAPCKSSLWLSAHCCH